MKKFDPTDTLNGRLGEPALPITLPSPSVFIRPAEQICG
jgi:hypothetical protein